MWDQYQIQLQCWEVCPPGGHHPWEAARTYRTSGDVKKKKQKGLTQNMPSFIVSICQAMFCILNINANCLWSPTATGLQCSTDERRCTWVSYMCSEIYFHWEWFGSIWENSACQFKEMGMVSLLRPKKTYGSKIMFVLTCQDPAELIPVHTTFLSTNAHTGAWPGADVWKCMYSENSLRASHLRKLLTRLFQPTAKGCFQVHYTFP